MDDQRPFGDRLIAYS